MRISLVPWEFIWLLSWGLLALSLVQVLWQQIKQRQLSIPRAGLFYGSFLLLIAIPGVLQITGYRFKITPGTFETVRLDHEIFDLEQRGYEGYTVEQMYQTSLQVVQASQSYAQPWRIAFTHIVNDRVARIVVLVPMLWYTDELIITIEKKTSVPGLWVLLHSQTDDQFNLLNRDFGENARHIKQFYNALDTALSQNH